MGGAFCLSIGHDVSSGEIDADVVVVVVVDEVCGVHSADRAEYSADAEEYSAGVNQWWVVNAPGLLHGGGARGPAGLGHGGRECEHAQHRGGVLQVLHGAREAPRRCAIGSFDQDMPPPHVRFEEL
eukprot:2119673-Pyramimonas_sp.AAC.1